MSKTITAAFIVAATLGIASAADARPRYHGYYGHHHRMMMRHHMHHRMYHR